MKILGFDITRTKAASAAALAPVADSRNSWWLGIRESFTGAWQRNITVPDDRATLLAFSAVYACCSVIASDIGKLPLRAMFRAVKKNRSYWRPAMAARVTKLLNKPNHYQTRSQFIEQIVLSRLIHGNAYILKGRDSRGLVDSLYVLEPTHVTVLVGEDGSIFYQLKRDDLSEITEPVIVPQREMMHDRAISPNHPLVGVSPISACGWPATLGNRIQRHSATFFANGGRPSGVLTSPGAITPEIAERMKEQWEANYSGNNVGKIAVLGDNLKYESMAVTSNDAQLIEQLKWTVEDVARCFRVPLYMIGAGQHPTFNNVEALQRVYFTQTLQAIIESLEIGFDNAFELEWDSWRVEFDTGELLRMDSATRYAAHQVAINGGWKSPNEVREEEGLPAVEGGDSPMMQSQNWSLAALAQRDSDEAAAGSEEFKADLLDFGREFSNELDSLLSRQRD